MNFRELRQKIGTQEEVAKLLKTQQNTVSGWENGVSFPKTKDLRRIADVLGVGVGELVEALERSKREV